MHGILYHCCLICWQVQLWIKVKDQHNQLNLIPHLSYEVPLPEGNTSGSAEANIQLKELMVLVPSLVTRVTSLEKELKDHQTDLRECCAQIGKEGEISGKSFEEEIQDSNCVCIRRQRTRGLG
ncbi:hypothetical protein Tco_0338518, partial [Tanacetum coccineum]